MTPRTLAVALCIALFALSCQAEIGFDLSYFQGNVAASVFSCLHNSGYQFGCIEATKGSQAALNPYISSVVANARQYFHNIDVYIFPNTDQDAATQMTSYINSLKADGVLTTNMVWMDIEGSQYWSSSCSTNQQWLSTAIATIQSLYSGCGLPSCVGIYTGSSQWSPIMCNTAEFSSHPLWYAHYDNKPSFSDFTPFGGWTQPNIKQYEGTTYVCGTAIDEDYY